MKPFGTTCSVSLDSRDVFSSTNCYWGKISENAILEIEDAASLFRVQRALPIHIIENCNILNKNSVVISKNLSPMVQPGDIFTLEYSQYELDQFTIIDAPTLIEKDVFISASPEEIEHIIFRVEQGKLVPMNKGLFMANKASEISLFNSQNQELKILASLITSSIKPRLEIECINVIFNNTNATTTLYFRRSLPVSVESATISCSKWKIILTEPFYNLRGNCYNKPYKIYSHLTPNFLIPLFEKNTLNESLLNQIIIRFDEELFKVKQLIKNEQHL